MWDFTILGVDFYHIVQWFFLYSFLGWLWETTLVSVKNHKFVNRGFINGPFCTIYGCGALSVYLILRPLEGKWVLLFVGGIVVATALEYVTAVLMETIFHTSWWDYSDSKFNFQGRICLGASLGWGFFTLLLFWALQPFMEWIVGLYSVRAGKIAACIVTVLYVIDFSFSASAAFRLSEKVAVFEEMVEEKKREFIRQLHKHANPEYRQRLEEAIEGAGESLERLRDNLTDSLNGRLESLERLDILELRERLELHDRIQLKKSVEELKKQWASHQNFITRRYVHAYPHLNRAYRIRQHRKNKKARRK